MFGHAIYGERDRGHRLLAASRSFPDPDALAGRMDMQGTPPPHTEWRPYVSGFLWNAHYVLSRTTPDSRSSRSGMVFSRAISVPVQQIGGLADVLGLFEVLAELGDARDGIDDIAWRPGTGATVPSPGLIQALLAEGTDPVVWIGQDGFEPALAHVWKMLWPSARLRLEFRIAFSPTDVASEPPTLVTTPASLQSRWSSYRTVSQNAPSRADDAAEAYLTAGTASAGLAKAIEAFGARLPRIGDLNRLVEQDQLLQDGGAFRDYVDALRFAGHFAGEGPGADALKTPLIAWAVKALPGASAVDIRMARNLSLVSPAASSFWQGVSDWAHQRLWREAPNDIVLIFDDVASTKPEPEWRDAVRKGIGRALSLPGPAVVDALWKVMKTRPTALMVVIDHARPKTTALETALVGRPCGAMTPAIADSLIETARRSGLNLLAAECLAVSRVPIEAIRRHNALGLAEPRSLRVAARKASAKDLVAAAIEHGDPLTLDLAAEAASKKPAVLAGLDVKSTRWRALWSDVLRRVPAASTTQERSFRLKLKQLLDAVADGTVTDHALLAVLADTPLADLSQYARNAQVWSRLQEPARRRFLEATATGWVSAVECGTDLACDDELARELVESGRLDGALRRLRSDLTRGCQLFRTLPRLQERQFVAWLRAALDRGSRLSLDEAEAVGRLVASRNWKDAARAIADAITDDGKRDLRPAVDYVVELIDGFRRWLLDESGAKTPAKAKWRILEEIALELYGYGPGADDLWQRAGGEAKHIPQTETGVQAWRKVIGDAEKGKGHVDVDRLIDVMASDYPNHRALQKLHRDTSFVRRS